MLFCCRLWPVRPGQIPLLPWCPGVRRQQQPLLWNDALRQQPRAVLSRSGASLRPSRLPPLLWNEALLRQLEFRVLPRAVEAQVVLADKRPPALFRCAGQTKSTVAR